MAHNLFANHPGDLFFQISCEAETVNQAENKRQPPAAGRIVRPQQIFHADINDGGRNQWFDDVPRDSHHIERCQRQRRRVRQSKAGNTQTVARNCDIAISRPKRKIK